MVAESTSSPFMAHKEKRANHSSSMARSKTARTVISRYSGGLNGDGMEVTLKKVGDEWFAQISKCATCPKAH
jgi:hypothetical protein